MPRLLFVVTQKRGMQHSLQISPVHAGLSQLMQKIMQKNNVENNAENQVLYKDSTQESKEGLDWEKVCLKKNEIVTQV